MSKEELVQYMDARIVCSLSFFTVNNNSSISFSRSIVKSMDGEYTVRLGDAVMKFHDARMAAACFVKMLKAA
jgi:hypothetical protein